MKRKILNNSGITLLELVVSIAILSIILITFAGLFTNAFKYNAMSGDKLQSVNIAQEYANKIKEDQNFRKCINELKNNYTSCAVAFQSSENLVLRKDITSDQNDPEYHSMQLADKDTNVIISIKISKEPTKLSKKEIPETTSKSLYRLAVEIKKNETDKMPSKTYLYYEY
ncbi:prepilin-type N-terminal cleavage/methylation domain-containing protein [Metabacillus fastidiosus]|uniref:prepilin-type N-terminal cleavage/methylation domain-containing protein n=1 Tax=Metabacillus fastidiosus TaxID=1458 RepID=UPI003D2725B1